MRHVAIVRALPVTHLSDCRKTKVDSVATCVRYAPMTGAVPTAWQALLHRHQAMERGASTGLWSRSTCFGLYTRIKVGWAATSALVVHTERATGPPELRAHSV